MQASKRLMVAVLAVAAFALLVAPAAAYGVMKKVEPGMHALGPQDLGAHDLGHDAEGPVHVERMVLDPDVVAGILESLDEPEIGDGGSDGPVFPDGGGEAPPWLDEFPEDTPIEDAGDDTDGRIVPQQETTPSIPTTPTVPDRPYLPYTGGDSTAWAFAGIAVAALGVALVAYGAGARRGARAR